MSFKFNLNDRVAIEVSGEEGNVVGRAEYTAAENAKVSGVPPQD